MVLEEQKSCLIQTLFSLFFHFGKIEILLKSKILLKSNVLKSKNYYMYIFTAKDQPFSQEQVPGNSQTGPFIQILLILYPTVLDNIKFG